VLVFHGTPGSRLDARFWEAAANDAGITARFVGFDRPGYGSTPAQPGRTLQSVAEQAASIIEEPVRLLAMSGGGPYALATAAAMRDRVASVTIVSGMGPPQCGMGALGVTRDMSEAEVGSWATELIATAQLAPTGVKLHDLFIASQLEGMHRPEGIVDDVLTLRAPWTIELEAVAAPVTLLHAVDDESCPIEGARFLARVLPRAVLVEWQEGSHLAVAVHLPDVLGRVVA